MRNTAELRYSRHDSDPVLFYLDAAITGAALTGDIDLNSVPSDIGKDLVLELWMFVACHSAAELHGWLPQVGKVEFVPGMALGEFIDKLEQPSD